MHMEIVIIVILGFAAIGISILNTFERWLETYNDSKDEKQKVGDTIERR